MDLIISTNKYDFFPNIGKILNYNYYMHDVDDDFSYEDLPNDIEKFLSFFASESFNESMEVSTVINNINNNDNFLGNVAFVTKTNKESLTPEQDFNLQKEIIFTVPKNMKNHTEKMNRMIPIISRLINDAFSKKHGFQSSLEVKNEKVVFPVLFYTESDDALIKLRDKLLFYLGQSDNDNFTPSFLPYISEKDKKEIIL